MIVTMNSLHDRIANSMNFPPCMRLRALGFSAELFPCTAQTERHQKRTVQPFYCHTRTLKCTKSICISLSLSLSLSLYSPITVPRPIGIVNILTEKIERRMCLCVSVCVFVRDRQREKRKERKTESEGEGYIDGERGRARE